MSRTGNVKTFFSLKSLFKVFYSAVVALDVAQLVEWSLPTPEVPGSNPVIGINLY